MMVMLLVVLSNGSLLYYNCQAGTYSNIIMSSTTQNNCLIKLIPNKSIYQAILYHAPVYHLKLLFQVALLKMVYLPGHAVI